MQVLTGLSFRSVAKTAAMKQDHDGNSEFNCSTSPEIFLFENSLNFPHNVEMQIPIWIVNEESFQFILIYFDNVSVPVRM